MVDILGSGFKKKSPWGQWVQYKDKRGRGIFYYNVVSGSQHRENYNVLNTVMAAVYMDCSCNVFAGISPKPME